MKILGRAHNLTIVRKCANCNDEFCITCEDYIFNKIGTRYKDSENKEAWVCPECLDHLIKIKNLGNE